IAVYLFLCLVANQQGVSWYRRDRIREALNLGEEESYPPPQWFIRKVYRPSLGPRTKDNLRKNKSRNGYSRPVLVPLSQTGFARGANKCQSGHAESVGKCQTGGIASGAKCQTGCYARSGKCITGTDVGVPED
ncbi:MAG: hypothetical protein P8182_20575, partial [Deltaproteobacteria bacterium]